MRRACGIQGGEEESIKSFLPKRKEKTRLEDAVILEWITLN
jgi:hypothetical protein